MNPVRARMAADPADYPWSSCRTRLGLSSMHWLDPDPCYLALAEQEHERRQRYRRFLDDAIAAQEWNLIREAVQRGQLTGSARFAAEVAAITGRRIERRGQGRPAKTAEVN
jgi:putative transposase